MDGSMDEYSPFHYNAESLSTLQMSGRSCRSQVGGKLVSVPLVYSSRDESSGSSGSSPVVRRSFLLLCYQLDQLSMPVGQLLCWHTCT